MLIGIRNEADRQRQYFGILLARGGMLGKLHEIRPLEKVLESLVQVDGEGASMKFVGVKLRLLLSLSCKPFAL